MADEGNLSAEQTDQLSTFQEITQIESIEECKQILEAFSWNVESAIQNSFNEKDQVPTTSNLQASHASSNASSQSSLNSLQQPNTSAHHFLNEFNNHTHNHFMNTAITSNRPQPLPNVNIFTQRTLSYYAPSDRPVIPQGIFQWSVFIVTFPFKLIFSTLVDIAQAFWSFYSNSTAIPIDYDPLANIAEFAIQYNTAFGTDHVDFYQGSYAQAVNEAKRQLKFLVVYLHQNDNADCETFARQTMTNPDLIQFLQMNTVFWACSKNLPEGQKVFSALKARRCPFLGIIVYKRARMTLVSKIEGPASAAELLLQINAIFSENEAELIVARQEKEERNETLLIRQMQDQAYEESLKADREKARLKKEKEQKQAEVERLERERLEKEMANVNEIENKRQRLRSILADISEPDGSHPDSIKVLIKLPTGSRHQRIFKRSEPVKNLYNFVFANEECPSNFEIATNFPHRIVNCTEESEQTFEESGINQSMLLFVNDLDA